MLKPYTIIHSFSVGSYGSSITGASHVELENDQDAAFDWADRNNVSIWFIFKGHCEYAESWSA